MKDKTILIRAGYNNQECYGAMNPPIFQTTAYEFRDSEHAANLFDLSEVGPIYTRINNPTTEIFEKRICELERGEGAVATASGTAAIFYTFANVAEAGDNIIIAKQAYGGTLTLGAHTIRRFGIEARFFDIHNLEELESLIDDRTKLIFFEIIPNPAIEMGDIKKIAKIAKEHNILLCADNTVATPILCKPLKLGADIVVHSTSKYINGNGSAIGGVIVEGKSAFKKIKDNKRYYHFNEPDKSYHGLVYSELKGAIFTLRARLALLRDFGGAISPFNSWLNLQGLETLALRMKQHSKSALKIAKFLESHPKVLKVNYPGLKSNPSYKYAKKYLKKGRASGLLSFEVESREFAQKVAESTKIFSLVVNIGDSKSIITHPASTTHQQLSPQELIDAGVPGGLIRLSVGLEDVDDLIDDLNQALS
ncbi:MAG: O-acetylhomoserine aminocarboxypropyltransferase/cysteine synthase [Epsilonproteobacteria bacterium]|nr:O-acetylhomoserine aminocarboxypropyltransferase/cysteine synthase [Campylobacterota bacterium]